MNKRTLSLGAGAGIGIAQAYVTREYLDYPIPFICDHLGNWGTIATLGNIIIGGVALGISKYTKLIKNDNVNSLIGIYGLVTMIGGIVNGLVPVTPLGALDPRLASGTGSGDGYFTQTYYPGFRGQFYRRPESPARGFGSDVTKNPMAAIPTTVPYNKIIF